ncbi:hypothetical protein DRQ07_02315 [candidate division KSB1 bacterium]|nr:MAG: hypothetical protein DRQ07_02315 [candidate division KSB1 bacterium]
MPEKITFNEKLGIIEILSFGDVTREDSLLSLKKINELMEQTGCRKLLSDTRKQESTPDAADIYNFGKNLPHSIKLAVIVSENQPTLDDVVFVDNVAYNRGINVKMFHSKDTAVKWLIS